MQTVDPFDDRGRHLKHLTDEILRDTARNECAPRDYRKLAVEILLVRKSPYVKHEDLRELVHELNIELDGLQFEYPAPPPSPTMTAGFTTKNLFGEEVPIPEVKDQDAPQPESA